MYVNDYWYIVDTMETITISAENQITNSRNETIGWAQEIDSKIYFSFVEKGVYVLTRLSNAMRSYYATDISTYTGGSVGGVNAAYVPTITIAKSPSGGGTSYEPINLFGAYVRELFTGDGTSNDYQLSLIPYNNATTTTVTVEYLVNGTWTVFPGSWTINTSTGKITFASAVPPKPTVVGEDNVRITYPRNSFYSSSYPLKAFATNYTHTIAYGENGEPNRLVLSTVSPSKIYYGAANLPAYMPDINYITITGEVGEFVNTNGKLAAIKNPDTQNGNNVQIFEYATLNDDVVYLKTVRELNASGKGFINRTAAKINDEVLYTGDDGVFAITYRDGASDTEIAQRRSYYIDGKLKKAINYNTTAFAYKNKYYIFTQEAINSPTKSSIFILDGDQPVYDGASNQYSTRQYCGFYRELCKMKGIVSTQAGIFFVDDENHYLCTFFTDEDDINCYADGVIKDSFDAVIDEGKPIYCCWETPDIVGKLFYKNKTLRYIAVKVKAAVQTSLDIYVMKRGLWELESNDVMDQNEIWELINSNDAFARFFQFSRAIFSKFTFSTDKTNKICHTKARIKKVDHFRLRLENTKIREPFGLDSIGLEIVESGNYKG